MPFTVNVGPYVGGQLMSQGLQNFGSSVGQGIQKAIEESRKQEEEQGADQVILNFAKQQGMVTPDMEAQYLKGSSSAKTGIVAGLVRQFAMTQQKKQVDSLEEQRQASVEERQQRSTALKTANENALLASEPPTQEQRTTAQQSGYDYLFDPTKQIYTLQPMQGDSGRAGKPSDKVPMTIQTPDGPKQILVTGNYYHKTVTNPVDFKKTYGATQSEVFDPTKTQVGIVDPDTGAFTAQAGGDYIRYNIHKDKQSGVEVDSGHIPLNEWNTNRQRVSQASQSTSDASGTPAPTATPPRGAVKAGGYQVGDPINLKNGQKVKISKILPDGKFEVVPQ
jgi:hypothetical protein